MIVIDGDGIGVSKRPCKRQRADRKETERESTDQPVAHVSFHRTLEADAHLGYGYGMQKVDGWMRHSLRREESRSKEKRRRRRCFFIFFHLAALTIHSHRTRLVATAVSPWQRRASCRQFHRATKLRPLHHMLELGPLLCYSGWVAMLHSQVFLRSFSSADPRPRRISAKSDAPTDDNSERERGAEVCAQCVPYCCPTSLKSLVYSYWSSSLRPWRSAESPPKKHRSSCPITWPL